MKQMKHTLCLLLAVAILLSLCACGSDPKPTEPLETTPTTQGQPASTDPTQQVTDPVATVDPKGVYRCTGIHAEGENEYQQAPDGNAIELYDDGFGMIYVDDYIYDLYWTAQGNQFTATTVGEVELPLEGIFSGDVLEVVFDGIYLRFEKKSQEEFAAEAVDFLRMMMEGTPQKFAVAYLGWKEEAEALQSWMEEKCPALLDNEPFISLIPQEQIIGTAGEVYCVVPADPNCKVEVRRLQDTPYAEEEGVKEVLYEGESGEPFIVMCNAGDFYQDTQVIFTDKEGNRTNWYPQTGEYGLTFIPSNDDLEELGYDFSYYNEVYPYGYNIWCGQGWEEPTQDYLSCICWSRYYEEIVDDGYIGYSWTMNLTNDGTGEIYFSDESGMERYATYTGSWQLTDLDGYPGLSLDMACADVPSEFEGKIPSSIQDAYVVLRAPDGDNLLLGVREGQDPCPMVVDGEDHYSLWWGAVG